MRPTISILMLSGLAVLLAASGAHAELLIEDRSVTSEYYSHPRLRSLVFLTPESRGQAILPPAPVFIAPPPLIWRPAGGVPPYPPNTLSGFNHSGTPSNSDLAAYNAARAQALRHERSFSSGSSVWFGPHYRDNGFWLTPSPLNTTLSQRTIRPSNAENARNQIERAHRYTRDD